MGFGFREADRFPLAIIRKFDLRPRLVVVNADGFFGGGLSPWAEVGQPRHAVCGAQAAAGKPKRRTRCAGASTSVVPNWLPLFGLPGPGPARAASSPTVRAATAPGQVSPWPEGTDRLCRPRLDGTGARARRDRRRPRASRPNSTPAAATLVLTRVPSPEPMPGAGPARFADAARRAAGRWPTCPGLTTADHSHLERRQRPRLDAGAARRARAARPRPSPTGRPPRPMNFVSWAFVALFLVVFAARLTIGRRKVEPAYVAVLLASSLVFYGWHVPVYLLVLRRHARCVDYVGAPGHRPPAARRRDRRRRRWLLVVARRQPRACSRSSSTATSPRAPPKTWPRSSAARCACRSSRWCCRWASASTPSRRCRTPIDVYRGQLAPVRSFRAVPALHQLLPAAGRRADRAGQRVPAADRRGRAGCACAVFYEGVWLHHLRLLPEDGLRRQPRRLRRRALGPGLVGRTPTRTFALWLGADVLGPDLRRLLRLLDHRARPRLPARLPLPDQLQRALHRRRRSRTSGNAGTSRCRAGCATTSTCRSAAIAARAPRTLRQPAARDAARRTVARRRLHLHRVGRDPRRCAWSVERVARAAPRRRPARPLAVRAAWFVVVQAAVLVAWIFFRSDTVAGADDLRRQSRRRPLAGCRTPWMLASLLFLAPLVAMHAVDVAATSTAAVAPLGAAARGRCWRRP